MKFDKMKCSLTEAIDGKYFVCSNEPLSEEFEQILGNNSEYMTMFRIMRNDRENAKMKTLIFADLSEIEKEVKLHLKNVLRLTASIKEILPDTENVDIYLFIAFSNKVTVEECIRIEATEQLCRKYVLLPNETINSFFERTFLSKIVEEKTQISGKDPLDYALSSIRKDFAWLSDEMEMEWKKCFLECPGNEIAEKIIYGVIGDGSIRQITYK